MSLENQPCIYHLDSHDHITFVGENWLRFALDNEAGSLTPAVVLGQPVQKFIADLETKEVYRMVFSRVRQTGAALTFPFRCDSPTVRRFMNMEITPLDEGGLQFRTQLVRVEPRVEVPWLRQFTTWMDEMVVMCSWCKRVQLTVGVWVEIEEAIKSLDLFLADKFPQISHGICRDCRLGLERELGAIKAGQKNRD